MKTHTQPIKILKIKEKQEIIDRLKKQFGIKDIQGIITMRGKERLFLYQGDLKVKNILTIEETVPIERIGVYFAKYADYGIRLSIEGTHILKDQITKNIFEIKDKKMMEQWMQGQELAVKTGINGFIIMKYKDDFLGTGKASEEKITNFIPKSRRLRIKT